MEWIHTPESPLILWVSGRLSGMFPEKCRPTDIYGPCDPQAPRTSYADPRVLPIFWWRRHGRCIKEWPYDSSHRSYGTGMFIGPSRPGAPVASHPGSALRRFGAL